MLTLKVGNLAVVHVSDVLQSWFQTITFMHGIPDKVLLSAITNLFIFLSNFNAQKFVSTRFENSFSRVNCGQFREVGLQCAFSSIHTSKYTQTEMP